MPAPVEFPQVSLELQPEPEPVPEPAPTPEPEPTPEASQKVLQEPETTAQVSLEPRTWEETLFLPAQAVADALGIEYESLMSRLDKEDLTTIGGEPCIASLGIHEAVAMAKRLGRDTYQFETTVRLLEQDHHKGMKK